MRILAYIFLLFCVLFLVGCPKFDQVQIQTANSIAVAANSTLPTLVSEYRAEGIKAIQASKTEEEAVAKILAVQKKWEPIWNSWKTLKIAHDAWVTALEANGEPIPVLLALKSAYCGLLLVWPKEIPTVPLANVICGK